MQLFSDDLAAEDAELRNLFPALNLIVGGLRSRLVTERDTTADTFLFDRAHIVTQSFVRRSLAFVEAGIDEYRAGRSLIASVCARSNLENVAACCDFAAKAMSFAAAGDRDALLDLLQTRTFATRDPELLAGHGKGMDAVNILTQINRLDSKHPGFRGTYDRLSEFTHPNAMGTTIHYATVAPYKITYHDDSAHARWGLSNLVISTFELHHMDESISALEKALVGFH